MRYENFSLIGKTALITGGAGLLGVQHAAAIYEAGGSVVITDLNISEVELIQKKISDISKEGEIHIYKMDVTNKQDIRMVQNNLISKNIHVDILINNAAINSKVNATGSIGKASRLENFDLDQWNLEINVGLTGAFLCSQVFGQAMANKNSGGVILNIASDLSVISPDQRLYKKDGLNSNLQPVKPVTYSVIKSGLIGLTKYLATYWCDHGIRCNALSPGGVYLDQGIEFTSRVEKLIPLGRMAKVDEYKSTIQYLCSDASSYMNGQNVVVDGGRSIW
jgi:NAD(P)-dependent dehydrogenase (short-subunit alcohol dehydrogenase family)